MRVMIVGGTGFLGYYSALEFLKREHEVSSISIPDIDLSDWFPKRVQVEYQDVFESSHEELVKLIQGHDVMVYAVGPDDRVTPKAPAYPFFHERLVEACTKVVGAAKDAGIKRCVILGSYFEYFDYIMPEKKLSDHHPYIKCRVEQSKSVIAMGGDSMSVMVLQLPYIFGAMPKRIPLWKDILFERIRGMKVVFFPRGGTNMIAVEHVAEAIVGAAEHGRHGVRYLIGDENISWKEMIRFSLDAMGLKRRKIVTIPTFLASLVGKWMKRRDSKNGKESGLDYAHFFDDIQSQEFYYDVVETVEELGYGRGGVKESIEETVRACYPIE